MQSKCIRFCLKLDKMDHISEEDFKTINWPTADQRVQQSLNIIQFLNMSIMHDFITRKKSLNMLRKVE